MVESHPYSFLDGTIGILVVDDDKTVFEYIQRLLRPMKLYSLSYASSNYDAVNVLRSHKRFHLCIADLGLLDMEDDEFYIVRHYAQKCAAVIFTDSKSPAKGATCIQLGARAVYEKGDSFDPEQFTHDIRMYALLNMINYRYYDNCADTLGLATKILFEKKPKNVTEWADLMRISDRQLRRLWHTDESIGAKYTLFLFYLYTQAFEYYNKVIQNSGHFLTPQDSSEYSKFANYFHSHRSTFSPLLS